MSERTERPPLILASGSSARREMLATAGVAFRVMPSGVDEPAIRDSLLAADATIPRAAIAEELALAKAFDVSARAPGAFVIGSDQVLALGETLFEKPNSLAEARAALQALNGKTHALHSSVILAQDKNVLWRHTSTARLTMRAFSDEDLDRYLAAEGESVCSSVGAYKIEGPAIALFEHIEGDHWTILGMPLLPLLGALHARDLLS